jgi:VWFA-related protein
MAGAQPAGRQRQTPTFRSVVSVVRLDVSVLGRNRTPIRGLRRDDFTVLVDGVEQPLVDASEVDYLSAGDAVAPTPRPPPGFTSNQAAPTRRAFVLILDDGLTPAEPFMLEYARTAAKAFVQGLHPDDLVAVVHTWTGSHSQDFTTDRDRVLEAIERFEPGPTDFSWSPFVYSRRTVTIPLNTALVRTLRDAIANLNAVPHLRGAIVLVSPGPTVSRPEGVSSRDDPLDLRMMSEAEVAYRSDLLAAAGEAAYARIPIYTISNRGLVAPGSGRYPRSQVGAARIGNDFLKTVASSSGGFAVVDTNDPLPGVQQALLENSHRYVIGYEATYPVQDGRFRRLEIRVSRPGARVFPSGRQIGSPKPPEREPVLSPRAAIAGILPIPDVPLAVRVAVREAQVSGNPAEVTAALEVGPIEGAAGEAHVECVAFDAARLKEFASAVARVAIAGAGRPTAAGLRFALAPGRYNLRCGVYVPALGTLGSVYANVTVPASRNP